MITLRSFYPIKYINNMSIEVLEDKYNTLKNRVESGYILNWDTLLLEAFKHEINERNKNEKI